MWDFVSARPRLCTAMGCSLNVACIKPSKLTQQQSKEPADTEWLETYTWYEDGLNVFSDRITGIFYVDIAKVLG